MFNLFKKRKIYLLLYNPAIIEVEQLNQLSEMLELEDISLFAIQYIPFSGQSSITKLINLITGEIQAL